MHLKDIIPLISSAVVICIFIIDRLIAYNIRKKELNRTWYFKVLLEPKLNTIDDFYKETESQISIALRQLQLVDFDTASDAFIKCQLESIDKFKETKRKYELEVLKPIMSRYPAINNNLIDITEQLVNDFTLEIDTIDPNTFKISSFSKKLYENKIVLLDILYKLLNAK